jgi:hypothetical protein
MYYVIKGMKSFVLSRQLNSTILIGCTWLLCITCYYTGVSTLLKEQSKILQGPQEKEAVEAFDYIKRNTRLDDTIVFIKPRALALYTGRYSYTNHPVQDSTSLEKKIELMKSRFFLLTSDLDNPSLYNYVKRNSEKMTLLFRNSSYEFYKLNSSAN